MFAFGQSILTRSFKIALPNYLKVQRNDFFTEFETKINRFVRQAETYKKQKINLADCQKVVQEVIRKDKLDREKDIELLKFNLGAIVHLGSKQHIPLILEALQKLEKNEIRDLKFHVPFVRLVYHLNQIDFVIDLLKKENKIEEFVQKCILEEWKRYFVREDLKTYILVLDKLVEQKRYDDVWKFYKEHLTALPQIPSSMLNAVTFSLMKINTADSFSRIKELVSYCDSKKQRFGVNSLVQIFMAAIFQKDYIYAIRFMVNRPAVHQNLYNNLIAIAYSCMNQPIQALFYAKSALLINRIKDQYQGFIFKTTLEYLESSVNRCKNDAKVTEMFAEIKAIISRDASKLKNEDIVEFHSKSTEGTFTKTFNHQIRSNYSAVPLSKNNKKTPPNR